MKQRPQHGRRPRGFVLVVVLVLLVVMTGVVVYSVRRATADDRMVGAMRDAHFTLGAADSALRFCEHWLWVVPPGLPKPSAVNVPEPPATIVAPAPTATAAWRVASNWTNSSVGLPDGHIDSNVTARCLIEDASAELVFADGNPRYDSLGDEARFTAGGALQAPLDGWRKYRITAEVVSRPGGIGLTRTARAQSEMRFK
jgi:Tfp pilus assembly protein PilX